jgi:hypothetical protein
MARCSAALVVALVAFCFVGIVSCTNPPVPRIVTSTMTGVILTTGPSGLQNQLPFTLRVDPANQRARLDVVYYFQTMSFFQVCGYTYRQASIVIMCGVV